MSQLPDNERLLKDVLAEESADGFREALLSETLRQAKGRRRRRLIQRVGGALAVMVVATFLVWRNLPQSQTQGHQAVALPPLNYLQVQTQPLPAAMLVETRPLTDGQYISSFETVGVIRTTSTSGRFREIGDGELLALAPGPAALVRRSPREAELILLKSTDDERPEF